MASNSTDRRFGLGGSFGIKAPVDLATTGNITLSGEQIIDGVLTNESRVLAWQQDDPIENGIYDTSTGAWTRAIDANGNNDLKKGTLVAVTGGTQAGAYFHITSANPIQPGTTSMTWVQDLTNTASGLQAQLASQVSAAGGAGMIGFAYALAYGVGTVGRWLKDLALSTGAGFIGWIATGTGAVLRTIEAKLRGEIHFEDFGAVGDGVTDDSAALLLASNRASIGTTPSRIKGTPGKTYLMGDWNIVAPNLNNNSRGEYSLVLDFRGCTLKGKASATRILLIGADAGTTTWTNGVEILGGTLDMSLMTDASTRRGIELRNAYKCKIDGVSVVGEGSNKIGLYLRDRVYTTRIDGVSMARCNLVGNILASDAVTTIDFNVPDITKLTLTRCSTIRVNGGAIQSAAGNKVDMSEVYDVSFNEVDVEGAAGTAFAMGASCSYVRVNGGNISGALTRVSGEGTGCRFDTRGEYGRTQGSENQVTSSSTAPNTIWTFSGDQTSGGLPIGFGFFVVKGSNATDGFWDLVSIGDGVPTAEISRTKYGAPAARSYSMSGTNFRVTMATTATINLSTLNLWNPR